MNRTDILNYLIRTYNYKTYLEIGLGTGENYKKINGALVSKVGIDPNIEAINSIAETAVDKDTVINMTSDEFFRLLGIDIKYDLIFIDGLHLEHQVKKDIENSIKHLNPHGMIVLHDCNPPTEQHAAETFIPGTDWNGTVYKAYIKFMHKTEDFDYVTVDTDWGVGIIVPRTLGILPVYKRSLDEKFTYKNFDEERAEMLNLISEDMFLQTFVKSDVLGMSIPSLEKLVDMLSDIENFAKNYKNTISKVIYTKK